MEAELITVTPKGFDPPEIKRPAGQVFLLLENRSGASDLTFELNRIAGSKLKEVNLKKGTLSWRPLVDLTPGDYALTEVNHPDWVCKITITAK